MFAGQEDFLSNIVHLFNVGSTLGQRRRRWPSIKTALDQCPVSVVSCNQFGGYINAVNLYSIGYCWPTLDCPSHARFAVESFFTKITSKANSTLGFLRKNLKTCPPKLSPAFHVSRNMREYTREETRTDIKLVRVFPC